MNTDTANTGIAVTIMYINMKPSPMLPVVSIFTETISIPSTALSTVIRRFSLIAEYMFLPVSAMLVTVASPSRPTTAAIRLLSDGWVSVILKRSTYGGKS